jgi:tetratricopeptide (TPR) repeat protein
VRTESVVELGGSLDDHWSVPLVETSGPLLKRAAAGATIARLADRYAKLGQDQPGQGQRLRQRIISLSTRHRVLSDFTAMLVLETEQDYRRYGIDRRALSDVLVVGDRGVERLRPAPPIQIARQGAEGPRARRQDDGNRLKSRPRLMRRTRRLLPEPRSHGPRLDGALTHQGDEGRAPSPGSGGRPRPAAQSSGEGYGYEFSDDPLAAPGFGPNDATIRTRPGPARARISDPTPTEAVAALLAQERQRTPPYTGRMAIVMGLVETGDAERAVVEALAWRNEQPGDVMALVALGETLEARGNLGLAARAYGSILDLYPARADMQRFAANRLERLERGGSPLAIDAYQRAVADRPDHLSGHRLLAFAQLRSGRHEQAFAAIEAAFRHQHRSRVTGAKRLLTEDLGLIGAAWVRHAPQQRDAILERLADRSAKLATEPSLRFVLTWETDANDVDLHVFDRRGGHAYYSQPELASGGRLYHDVTNGYGPECFVIHGKPSDAPYRLAVHYYARGPMGYGMGKVEIIEHDGQGTLRFDQRPFVVMNDQAFVDLGSVLGPKP